jgi:hypothetical protein
MAIFNDYTGKASVLRHLKAKGLQVNAGLSKPESNPKVMKNMLKGVLSSPLHLSPAKLSGYEVCPQRSAGCTLACLHTAGNPMYKAGKFAARLAKTKAYFEERKAFVALIAFEIEALQIKALRMGMQCAVRLNATSDIAWERVPVNVNGTDHKNLMDAFPDCEFYDYSKVVKRAFAWAKGGKAWPSNYHITFSKDEDNDDAVKLVLAAGGNVAAVFDKVPNEWNGVQVIDGDSHDFRPFDARSPNGCIVGLKAKGDAKTDASGFVVRLQGLTTKGQVI